MSTHLLTSIEAALAAGQAILEVYHSDFEVEHKADDSPLTLADRRAHEIILSSLAAFDMPVLSEEGRDIPYDERRAWQSFWLVDPLDGTKEFVKRNGEFTVNIALIENRRPVSGVIYVPDHDTLYFGAEALGSWRVDKARESGLQDRLTGAGDSGEVMRRIVATALKLECDTRHLKSYTVIGSRSHGGEALEAFVEKLRQQHDTVDFLPAGSSLKFCRVAEGAAHIYPRLAPTMEWDTGAGQAVAANAGARVFRYEDGRPLIYNKENLLNPWFVVKP